MPRCHLWLCVLTACLLPITNAHAEDEEAFTAEDTIELKEAGATDVDLLEALRATNSRPAFTRAPLRELERAGARPDLLARLRGAQAAEPKPGPAGAATSTASYG